MSENKIKPFFKINFEDLEIAERFFDNEKHFSEFLLAVSYYYRSKEYSIKQKIVQRYFETYKKTMDQVILSKITGSIGAKKRIENQMINKLPLEGPHIEPLKPSLDANNKVLSINNKEENNTNSAKAETLDFDLLMQYLNNKTGRKFKVISTKVKDKYKSTLKQGYTKDDIRTAIDNAVKAKNHIDNKFQYLTLEFFSRPEKLDMYSDKLGIKSIEGETVAERSRREYIENFKNIKIH